MIAKGNLHAHGVKLIDYLLTAERGERVEFGGVRGFDDFSPDMREAAARMQQFAHATTRAEKPWFHTQTRLAPGEQLTIKQWEKVLDREEKRLGFSGLPRAWSFHIDEATGEKHLHAAWFRVDAGTGATRDPGLFKRRLMEVARQSELEFALREVGNTRQPDDKARAPERKEMEESRRLGTDVRQIRAAILDCLEHSDNGRAFKAALEERGFMLANGDRRDCAVVVDQEGGHHALNKKLTGMTLAKMRERLADLDRSQLPGAEQAQTMQRERHRQVERTAEPPPEPEQPRRYDALRETERRVESERAFAAAATRTTEPAAPIWDRDADTRAADDRIIEAAIDKAASAAPDSRQRPEPTAGGTTPAEASGAASAQPAATTAAWEPDPERELTETAHAAVDAGSKVTRGVLGVIGEAIAGFISRLADSIAPPPPPTKDQAERLVRSAEEKQEARAEQQGHAEREAQHWLIVEAQQKAAREREEAVENEQQHARRREQDRSYERER